MENTVPQMVLARAASYPDTIAQFSKNSNGDFEPISYADLVREVKTIAAGLLEIGVRRGDHVGLISDNRKEWLWIDLAIMGLGAADVPRGCDATEQEIRFILDFSECRLTVLENDRQLKKILAQRQGLQGLKEIIMFDEPEAATRTAATAAGLTIRSYAELREIGAKRLALHPKEYEEEVAKGQRDDLATIIYTSGTTGDPKGVMLSHGNFLYQTERLPSVLHIKPGHAFLSVLPVWHSFERAVQYIIMTCAAGIAYSKPVGSIMLADMQAIRPHWFTSVPRIWESIRDGINRNIKNQSSVKKALFTFFVGIGESYAYFRDHLLGRMPRFAPKIRILEILVSLLPFLFFAPLRGLGHVLVYKKIKSKLGGRFIAGISGGGALPPSCDRFFSAIGILILEGYGLTETAPVIGVRYQDKPVPGTVGRPIEGLHVKIVDELGEALPPGAKGVIMVKGPTVMKGYYKRPDLTAKVLSEDGWLNTGDIGMLTRDGEIKITGRAKDTIVLLGGENLEPVPIEQKLTESEYIKQAVVLGQDQKYLAALIVPDEEAVTAWARENNVVNIDYETLLKQPEVLELIDSEINELVSMKNGFKSFERIFKFELLAKPFEVGRELSAKQEVKRHAINELYAKEIRRLFEQTE
jgi:long-chain acyl-CoA synthetase